MLAKCYDLPVQLEQAPLQHCSRAVFFLVENGANIAELKARVAIRTDLLQSAQLPFGVRAVVGRCAQCRTQEPERFVIENGGPADAAPPSELGDRKHRRTPTL